MANRVLLGNRATGGYGLYRSKTGEYVLDTALPMAFDSRTGTGWAIKQVAQGTLSGNSSTASGDGMLHSLGYKPLFAVRWCTANEISSGVATKVFTAVHAYATDIDTSGGGEPEPSLWEHGCSVTTTTSLITIENHCTGTIYWSTIIFNEPDFTGGVGL